MVSLFFIIFLALTVFFVVRCIKEAKSENGDGDVCFGYFIVAIIAGIVSIIFLIWVFILINIVGTGYTIDNKIAMYEEENASIEESINVTVKSYMDFEASTYGELKDKDAINLVSLFPELKSDTLVQKQIEVYVANNDKIKELKEEKIDLSKLKWKLYFGK